MGRSTATDIMSEDRITTSINTHPPLVEAARALGPAIWARRDEIEEGRRLPPPLVQVMAEAGLFRMLMPAQFGGGEVDPATALGVIEEVSQADGSAGWCLMIGATGGMLAAFLPAHGAREVFGRDPNVIAGGAVRQTGRAVAVDGGYRVTGRWAYGSGCQHSDWLIGGCVIDDGDAPRQGERGMPKAILPMLPAAECEIIDTWSVGGLRGTGSHDFAVSDLFVPEERVIPLPFPSPSQLGPLYAFPFFGLWGCCVASVATGIARGAIDALTELAAVKTPLASAGLLRERSTIQVQVAQAEATLRSARALMFDTVVEVWEAVVAGEPVSLDQRALLRLAAVHATTSAAQAVDLMYHAGGATANYTRSPLERAFRDVHAVTQHILVAPLTYEMTGRVLLSMEPGMPYI